MREEEKIFAGILFNPGDPELKAIKLRSHKLSAAYSRTAEDETELRAEIIRQMVAEFGEGSFMQGPVFFHYGVHTRIGKRCFFNYNLTIQDDAQVTIGDDNNFGPNLTIVTPLHPMLPDERRLMLDGEGNPIPGIEDRTGEASGSWNRGSFARSGVDATLPAKPEKEQ